MISNLNRYYNGCCDGCGRMLPAEYSEKAARAAMRRVGWIEKDGKDLCGLCQGLSRANVETAETDV